MNPQSTGPKSNVGLLQDLAAAVNGQAAAATFACGGSVPIVEPAAMANCSHSEPIRTCSPITLRYDAGSASENSKISFPLPPNSEVSQSMLDGLVNACQPATFGLEGKDVLDESYRKATKLDASAFSTNFHPHDCGIIESIQQILLPSTIPGGQAIGIGPQGARAELYNLNVCYASFHEGRFYDLVPFWLFGSSDRCTRFMLAHPECSTVTLIHRAGLCNLARLYACFHAGMKVSHLIPSFRDCRMGSTLELDTRSNQPWVCWSRPLSFERT